MYISPSNVIETGYTNGSRFTLNDGQTVYIGYYHKDKFERYWTGKTPTDDSEPLINYFPLSPVGNQPISYYSKLNKLNLPINNIVNEFIIPTEEEYKKGFFTRYILTSNKSSNKFVEVTSSSFNKIIQIPNIAILYSSTSLLWKLIGPINDIYTNNIRIESGIKDTNLRSIQEAEKDLKGISTYLTDPLQFSAK
jgi:hypothetical protein